VKAPPPAETIRFDSVSKFYGEVLGVNRVSLTLEPGITSLVGPNGSGKTTLMNLMTGLLRPSAGSVSVLGLSPDDPEALMPHVGYCSQFDSFPRACTGHGFVSSFLRVAGLDRRAAHDTAWRSLDEVGLADAGNRKVAGFSKGMRQRVKLASALALQPDVLVLDEPLNGLDPMARAEMMDLFKRCAERGKHVIISSHILHEVDLLSDSVVLVKDGYVVAHGDVHAVRAEVDESHPLAITVRCDEPTLLARMSFEQSTVVAAQIHDDGGGLMIRTRDADGFYALLGDAVVRCGLRVASVAPADDDVQALYGYLIESAGET